MVEDVRSRKELLARAKVYGLLARAFSEPDDDLLSILRNGFFLRALREGLDELPDRYALAGPYKAMERVVSKSDLNGLWDEYQRLFGIGSTSPPYETEYGRESTFTKANRLADIAGFYRAFGMRAPVRERPDHIGAEMEYLQVLLLKEGYARAKAEADKAQISADAQRKFFADHLLRWIPTFTDLVLKNSDGLYGALAQFARAFIARERTYYGIAPPTSALPLGPSPELGDAQCGSSATFVFEKI